MSASDLVLVVVSLAALGAAAALGAVTVWLVGVVRALQRSVAELVEETDAAVAELRAVLGQADEELDRASSVLGTLEEVSERVDAASEVAIETLSRPVIKAVSLGSGTARAARRLRRRERAAGGG